MVELVVHVARGGCATSPPTIPHNDKMRVWQTYGVLPKTPDIQQTQLAALDHRRSNRSRATTPPTSGSINLLSAFHALFAEVRLHSQSAISDCPTKPHRTLSVVGRTFTRLGRTPEYLYILLSVSIAIQLAFVAFGVWLLLRRDRPSARLY